MLASCAKKSEEVKTKIEGENLEKQMIQAYNEGLRAFNEGDIFYATKKFNEAELLYPQSEWAPNSSLMASYAYWTEGFHNDSINELKGLLSIH